MKNSFVLYTSYQKQLSLLTMEQRGILLTTIFAYVSGDDLPEMDTVTELAFSFIKADIDRDTEKYEKTIEARREAGLKGGRPKANGFSEKAKKANGFSEKQTKAKKADNDDVYEDVIKEKPPKGGKKKIFVIPTVDEVQAYITEKGYSVDANKFVDFYTSKDWMVGKNKMSDWKASVRTWARSQRPEMPAKANGFTLMSNRDFDWEGFGRAVDGV